MPDLLCVLRSATVTTGQLEDWLVGTLGTPATRLCLVARLLKAQGGSCCQWNEQVGLSAVAIGSGSRSLSLSFRMKVCVMELAEGFLELSVWVSEAFCLVQPIFCTFT